MEIILINGFAAALLVGAAAWFKRYEFSFIIVMQILVYMALDLSMPDNLSNEAVDAYYLTVSGLLFYTVHKIRQLECKTKAQLIAKHGYCVSALSFTLVNLLCIILDNDLIYTLHDTFGSMFLLVEVVLCLTWSVSSH